MGDVNSSKFGWLKKALYNPDQQTDQPVQQPVQPIRRTSTPTAPTKVSVPTPTVTPVINNGELDDQYINHLSDFMEKNNQPGPDYLEFARSLDEMISEMGDGVTEEKIFQMTYKVGYKQNLPVQKLVETANTYIGLFNQHKKEFNTWLDSENQKIVGSKVTENNNLSKMNSESLKKIDELTKQIESLNSSVDTNNVTIEQNNAVIEKETIVLENKKIKFENSFTFVVGKISDDIQKINTYLVNL